VPVRIRRWTGDAPTVGTGAQWRMRRRWRQSGAARGTARRRPDPGTLLAPRRHHERREAKRSAEPAPASGAAPGGAGPADERPRPHGGEAGALLVLLLHPRYPPPDRTQQ